MHQELMDLFGSEFYLEITNEERRYLGLNPVRGEWDVSRLYSKTNGWYKRTSLFWQENTIKKVIVEEKSISDGRRICESIMEYDTDLQTENREWLLPLTARGKKKKLSASNVLAVTPFGCSFMFSRNNSANSAGDSVKMFIYNSRNDKSIETGEQDRINKIQDDSDFHDFMKYYIETCPPDYFEKVRALRESKHVTVKYRTGDIFRMDEDRFRYCYGIITGKIKDIRKWKELPEHHSLRNLMMVPVMVRFYDICTTDDKLTVEKLADIPLGRVNICGDNDILWGTHEIIGHKELQEEDIEFPLVCTRIQRLTPISTVYTYDGLVADGMFRYPDSYNVYVEWGTAATILPYEKISAKLKTYLREYRSPHSGVAISIRNFSLDGEKSLKNRNNLLDERNREMREELFRCLQLEDHADFDDFAKKFGGLTKEEILRRL